MSGIVVILIAIIVAVPLLVPTSVYKEQVVSLVKKQTGRDLTIGGDVGLSFFPRLAVKVDDVDLSNATWAKDKSMASMKELRAAIKIIPLFSGNVEIDSFMLVDPVIHLEVKADGTPNWQFSDAVAPTAPAPRRSPASRLRRSFTTTHRRPLPNAIALPIGISGVVRFARRVVLPS